MQTISVAQMALEIPGWYQDWMIIAIPISVVMGIVAVNSARRQQRRARGSRRRGRR